MKTLNETLEEIEKRAEAVTQAPLDHPCMLECSGWRQGYERGKADTSPDRTKLLVMLRLAIEQRDAMYDGGCHDQNAERMNNELLKLAGGE
jgi:hypothetical protein